MLKLSMGSPGCRIFLIVSLLSTMVLLAGCRNSSTVPVLTQTGGRALLDEVDFERAGKPVGYPQTVYDPVHNQFRTVYCQMPRGRLTLERWMLDDDAGPHMISSIDSYAHGLNACVVDEQGRLHVVYARFATRDDFESSLFDHGNVEICYRGFDGEWTERQVVLPFDSETMESLDVDGLHLMMNPYGDLIAHIIVSGWLKGESRPTRIREFLVQTKGMPMGAWDEVTVDQLIQGQQPVTHAFDAEYVFNDGEWDYYEAAVCQEIDDIRPRLELRATRGGEQTLFAVDAEASITGVSLAALADASGVGLAWSGGQGARLRYGELRGDSFEQLFESDWEETHSPTLIVTDDVPTILFHRLGLDNIPANTNLFQARFHGPHATEFKLADIGKSSHYGANFPIGAAVTPGGRVRISYVSNYGSFGLGIALWGADS